MTNATTHPVSSIVVATDLSPAAVRAVEQAALLAKRWNATLSLLHVFDDSAWASIRSIYEAEHWSETEPVLATRNQLSELSRKISEHYALPVRVETRIGRPASAIAAFSRDQQAQLVVVGEHGQGWLNDNVLGSTAIKVVEQSGVPVLVARCPPMPSFRSILIATDFSDNALRAARQALDLFPDSSHVLVHVYQVAFESRMVMAGAMSDDIERYRSDERELAESKMDKQIARLGSDRLMTRMVTGRSAAAALVEEAGRLDADLTVIGRKGESSLAERLLGGTSESILYNSKCNVLLVP